MSDALFRYKHLRLIIPLQDARNDHQLQRKAGRDFVFGLRRLCQSFGGLPACFLRTVGAQVVALRQTDDAVRRLIPRAHGKQALPPFALVDPRQIFKGKFLS